jgi:hypothetical protein
LELAAEYPCKKAIAVPFGSSYDKIFARSRQEKVVLVTGSIFCGCGAHYFLKINWLQKTVR